MKKATQQGKQKKKSGLPEIVVGLDRGAEVCRLSKADRDRWTRREREKEERPRKGFRLNRISSGVGGQRRPDSLEGNLERVM